MSDPVAEKSGFLRMYMSNHPDTLVAYARWHGQVKDPLTSAEMSSIDSESMTLTCKLKDGTQKMVRILIDPPLSGYEEVKPRLLAMKADAQEGLGMIGTPQISTFRLPLQATTTAVAMVFLCYTSFFPRDSTSLLFRPAHFIWSVTGKDRTIIASWCLVFVLHGLESIYMYTLCRKHRTGFRTGATYCFSALLFGFPILMDFRKRVQAARIESVMKVE